MLARACRAHFPGSMTSTPSPPEIQASTKEVKKMALIFGRSRQKRYFSLSGWRHRKTLGISRGWKGSMPRHDSGEATDALWCFLTTHLAAPDTKRIRGLL